VWRGAATNNARGYMCKYIYISRLFSLPLIDCWSPEIAIEREREIYIYIIYLFIYFSKC
jgi:hypothetical protein